MTVDLRRSFLFNLDDAAKSHLTVRSCTTFVSQANNSGDVSLTLPFDVGLCRSIAYHTTAWATATSLPTMLKYHAYLNPLLGVEALVPVVEYIDIVLL